MAHINVEQFELKCYKVLYLEICSHWKRVQNTHRDDCTSADAVATAAEKSRRWRCISHVVDEKLPLVHLQEPSSREQIPRKWDDFRIVLYLSSFEADENIWQLDEKPGKCIDERSFLKTMNAGGNSFNSHNCHFVSR